MLEHRTGRHPEQPERLASVARHLLKTGLEAALRRTPCVPISQQRLTRLHTPAYLAELARITGAGGGALDADTLCSSGSWQAARIAGGSVCDAVEQVLAGADRQAFCLVRPPGHHALSDAAMGFCLLNNIALGAATAVADFDLDRVLIVDWDVHHGNGTQAMFWENEQVGFFSIHRWPFYPGTGASAETGAGAALGTKLNVPVEFGTTRESYLAQFRRALEDLAARIKPQLVLISAGFDAHYDDPIGSLGLEAGDFAALTNMVLDVADHYAGGRIVSVLEGGYNLQALAECVEVHVETLLDRERVRQNPAPRE